MVNVNENQQVKKRTSKGKQKTEIKKIEKKSSRQVIFSKRRNGLFHKCSQMSTAFGSEFAIITFSEAGNPFVSGYPSADSVIQRFLDDSRNNVAVGSEPSTSCLTSNDKWWENPIDDMSLDELKRFKIALEGLRKDVVLRVKRTNHMNDTQIINFGCNNSNLGVQEPAEIIDFQCTKASNNVHLSDFSTDNTNVENTNSLRVEPNNDTKVIDAINGVNLSDFLNENSQTTNVINCDNSVQETWVKFEFGCTNASNGIHLSDLCNETKRVDVGSSNLNLSVQESTEKMDFKGIEGSVGGKISDYYEWDNAMTEIYPELSQVNGCSFLDMLTCS